MSCGLRAIKHPSSLRIRMQAGRGFFATFTRRRANKAQLSSAKKLSANSVQGMSSSCLPKPNDLICPQRTGVDKLQNFRKRRPLVPLL